MTLSKALTTPQIETRSVIGLGTQIQLKMSIALGTNVKPSPAQQLHESMENFSSKADQKTKCKMCLKSLPTERYKAEKEKLARLFQQCCKCGNSTCDKHVIKLCKDCGNQYTLKR
jgi:hypothetical protein